MAVLGRAAIPQKTIRSDWMILPTPENSISFQEVLVSQDIEALVHNMNHNTTIRNSQIMERINLGTACVLMMAHAA